MPGKHLAFVNAKNEVAIQTGRVRCAGGSTRNSSIHRLLDGESIPLLMRQEGLIRNAIIVFFFKEGMPTFMRAFENNAEVPDDAR